MATLQDLEIGDEVPPKVQSRPVDLRAFAGVTNPEPSLELAKALNRAAALQTMALDLMVELGIEPVVPGSTAQRYAVQAQIAASMLRAARGSGVCRSFTVWGIGDAYSWLLFALGRTHAHGTPFDSNLQPKPFFQALLDGLA